MTEQQIQSKRIKQLEQAGYYVIKLIKTNKNGIPDIIAIPLNIVTGKLSQLQEYRIKELKHYGIKATVYYGKDE